MSRIGSLIREEYARKLSLLTGNSFEAEIVAALQDMEHGFQRIPRSPNGDGGLDGLSHSRSVAYCCYGPDEPKGAGLTDGKRRAAYRRKIVRKFKKDLKRLLELGARLANNPNTVLEGILGTKPQHRIMHIKLVCSWYDDNRIYGDVVAAFDKFLSKSARRFVDSQCQVVVWSPEDIACHVSVSQRTLARVEQPSLMAAITQASADAANHKLGSATAFEEKFDALEALRKSRKTQVAELRETFRTGWCTSIKLDEKLSENFPHLHAEFETARVRAATEANLLSLEPGRDPVNVILTAREKLKERMSAVGGGNLPMDMCETLADAETGRLIGECPLDWRQSQDD